MIQQRDDPRAFCRAGELEVRPHEPVSGVTAIFSAATSVTNFSSKGDELSFFQIRLYGTRIFISTTVSNTMPRGQCQRIDSVCQAIPTRHRTRPNWVSRSVAS